MLPVLAIMFITESQALDQFEKVMQGVDKGRGCFSCAVHKRLRQTYSDDLLVFVSFSLSDNDLGKLYKDAQRIGGKLLIRGLYQNSWKATAAKLRALSIAVEIDPEGFERHNVKSVPQFVLGDDLTRHSITLRGNVSLKFALEQFAMNGVQRAKILREKLESKP